MKKIIDSRLVQMHGKYLAAKQRYIEHDAKHHRIRVPWPALTPAEQQEWLDGRM